MRVFVGLLFLISLSATAMAGDRVAFHGAWLSPEEAERLSRNADSREVGGPVSQEFGTTDEFVVNIPAQDFVVRDGNWGSASFVNGDYVGVTSGQTLAALVAPVNLPNGVLIRSVTLYYYDNHTVANPSAGLWAISPTATGTLVAGQFVLPFSGGYTSATEVLGTPWTVDNAAHHLTYLIFLQRNVSEELRLVRVAVRCQRQVSMPPGMASFTDVPTTHPFYQFIEALAASGITAGCAGPPTPQFCPDAPITRGEMAVFLAAALGLHFPN
jgi:hypothetical protein